MSLERRSLGSGMCGYLRSPMPYCGASGDASANADAGLLFITGCGAQGAA